MRKLTIVFLLLTFIVRAQQVRVEDSSMVSFEQRMEHIFEHVDMSAITSNHLIDRAFQLCPIELYDGVTQDTANATTYNTWQHLYGSLYGAALSDAFRLPHPNSYLNISNAVTQDEVIPFVVIHFNYHKLRDDAVDAGLFTVSNEQLFDVANRTESPYLQKQAVESQSQIGM